MSCPTLEVVAEWALGELPQADDEALADVPFDRARGEVVLACQTHYRELPGGSELHVLLMADEPGGRRPLGAYVISTPVPPSPELPPGFSFNQFLVAADQPLLFHTGPRRMFPLVQQAVRSVLPPESLKYIAFSHVEGDECGSLAEWLALAPQALPVCSQVAAMIFGRDTRRYLERLAQFEPRLLACMHGSSFAGDGRAALLGLAAALEA